MKTVHSILAVICILCAGCKTIQITKEDVCDAAKTSYTIYLAIINADRHPSEDQIHAAKIAAEVLVAECGWSNPVRNLIELDDNGVPKLIPPML